MRTTDSPGSAPISAGCRASPPNLPARQRRLRRAARGESLLVIIDRSAREWGLAGALASSEPAGPGSLSVRLAKAPFDTLVGWLGRLAQQNGVSVESATIEKTDTPGLVSAAIVLHSG